MQRPPGRRTWQSIPADTGGHILKHGLQHSGRRVAAASGGHTLSSSAATADREDVDTPESLVPREFSLPVGPWPLNCDARLVAQFRTEYDDPVIRGSWWVELWSQRDGRYLPEETRLHPPVLDVVAEHLADDMETWRQLTDESDGLEYRRTLHARTLFINEFPPGVCLNPSARFPGPFVVRDFMLDEVLEALRRAAVEGPKLVASARRILTAEGIEVGYGPDPVAARASMEKVRAEFRG